MPKNTPTNDSSHANDPPRLSQYYGNPDNTLPSKEVKKDVESLLKSIDDGIDDHGNRITYNEDKSECTALFLTDGATVALVKEHIERYIKNYCKNKLVIKRGLGQNHGREFDLHIARYTMDQKRSEYVKPPTPKLDALKNSVSEFVRSVGKIPGIEIPMEKKAGIEQEIVQSVLTAALPKEAPKQYLARPLDPETGKAQNLVNFLEDAWYDPWIEAGLFTRRYFRSVDPSGEAALQNAHRFHKHIPFDVPTLKQEYDHKFSDVEDIRRARRMATAAERRRS